MLHSVFVRPPGEEVLSLQGFSFFTCLLVEAIPVGIEGLLPVETRKVTELDTVLSFQYQKEAHGHE